MEDINIVNSKKYAEKVVQKLSIGFTGPFGYHCLTPRDLLSSFLSTMIRLEGVVTRVSLITPKLQKSVHYCPTTKEQIIVEYRDASSLNGIVSNVGYRTKDDNGNHLETEYGLCEYV